MYGKNAQTVLALNGGDVDFELGIINFKGVHFPLVDELGEDIKRLCNSSGFLFFDVDSLGGLDNRIDVYRKKLRYYLSSRVKLLDVPYRVKHSGLSITELRRLRGQHLILDGVSLDVIKELYLQYDGTTTQFKKYLQYDELNRLKYPCDDMVTLFSKYTDLHIFDLEDFDDSLQFIVTNHDDIEVLVGVSDEGLVFVDEVSDDFRDLIEGYYRGGLLDDVELLDCSEFKLIEFY